MAYALVGIGLWLLIWPLYLGIVRPPATANQLTPASAYFLTLCCVGLLYLMLFGAHAWVTSGSGGELIWFLAGLLLLPTMILVDWQTAGSLEGWVFSGLVWALLGSLILPMIRCGKPDEPKAFPIKTDDTGSAAGL